MRLSIICCLLFTLLLNCESVYTQTTSIDIGSQQRFREMYPQISADGKTLYFMRGQHPRNQGAANSGDIWFRKLQEDGSWGRALNAGGPINSFAEDRLIGLSPDGRRLAVLRRGAGNAYVDILVRGQRSWRIVESRALAEALENSFSAAYDHETNTLFYSRLQAGKYDLFTKQAIAQEKWSEESPLSLLNTTADERTPYLSPDGGSLYFRRDGDWYVATYNSERQTFANDRSLAKILPSRYLQICTSVNTADLIFATTDELGNDERIIRSDFPITARPQTARLIQGKVSIKEAGSATAQQNGVYLSINGRARTVYPDSDGNYQVVIPESGIDQTGLDASGYYANVVTPFNNDAEIAGSNPQNPEQSTNFTPAYYEREQSINRFHREISATEAELEQLHQRRASLSERIRKAQLAAGREVLTGYIDPELSKLRSQISVAQENLRDTVPKPSPTQRTDRPTIRTESNAAAIEELEAMKARFKASQEARMGLTGEDYDWKSADPLLLRQSAEKQINEQLIPTISQEIVRSAYGENQLDSLEMERNIRSSLFVQGNRPEVYERQAWENQLLENIEPAASQALHEKLRGPLEASVAEERQIQTALTERNVRLYSLRDSLSQTLDAQLAEERSQAAPTGLSPSLTAKGIPATPQAYAGAPAVPDSYRLELTPIKGGNTITFSQLRFAPNSAIFKSGTERELDRFAEKLLAHPATTVEIGVHANALLSHSVAKRLSQERADRIVTYLAEKGVSATRLTAVGYGRERPIADATTPQGRLRNQRVEARIFE